VDFEQEKKEKNQVSQKKENIHQMIGENLELLVIVYSNGLFISLSQKEKAKLGTTAISLPLSPELGLSRAKRTKSPLKRDRQRLTSDIVLGSRNDSITKALAEKVTLATGKMVYLSTNLPREDESMIKEALQLIEKMLETPELLEFQ
jgi:hypothetical protein